MADEDRGVNVSNTFISGPESAEDWRALGEEHGWITDERNGAMRTLIAFALLAVIPFLAGVVAHVAVWLITSGWHALDGLGI